MKNGMISNCDEGYQETNANIEMKRIGRSILDREVWKLLSEKGALHQGEIKVQENTQETQYLRSPTSLIQDRAWHNQGRAGRSM